MFVKNLTRYRVYFNRRDDAPQLWSVDEGSQESEIHVQWIAFEGNLDIKSGHDLEAGKDSPTAWFEFDAKATFARGGATFRA